MQQPIVDFTKDRKGDWEAVLACGHLQHVRHQPPFVNRPWVATALGRQANIGKLLDCKRCDHKHKVD